MIDPTNPQTIETAADQPTAIDLAAMRPTLAAIEPTTDNDLHAWASSSRLLPDVTEGEVVE